ncbi:hypothetical protein [Altererythrobacter sp. MF3-039]|uniref:hypothetical protein n=1 Tax=Altererythrobacter sp. MF3-039 TaxID=3252901 RepID=UPI00390C7CC1
MNDPSIDEIGRTFIYHVLAKLTLPNDFVESESLVSRLEGSVQGALESAAGASILDSRRLAEDLFHEFVSHDVFSIKKIPFAQTVYKFKAQAYNDLRGAVLAKNEIYADSQQIPKYYESVFEGYKRTQTGERSDPYSQAELREVSWTDVDERIDDAGKATIRAKIIELATAIQQSELTDREKQNLLARTRAVQQLLDAPDPSWREIVEILNNKYLCAFLNTIAIIQLITMA